MKYVALLRGINVGGRNKVPMADLKSFLEGLELSNVTTYIASGNAFFESDKPADVLRTQIEKALPKSFALDSDIVKVLILTSEQVQAVIADAPKNFGSEPKNFRYDVIFILPPLTPAEAMEVIELKNGVDEAWAGSYAIYFRRLEARVTSSRVSKIVGKPEYKFMTLRNWNTTQKIHALMRSKKS